MKSACRHLLPPASVSPNPRLFFVLPQYLPHPAAFSYCFHYSASAVFSTLNHSPHNDFIAIVTIVTKSNNLYTTTATVKSLPRCCRRVCIRASSLPNRFCDSPAAPPHPIMKVFESSCTFDYPWSSVSIANWRKYCAWNTQSTHVVAVDTLSRSVDAPTGIVRCPCTRAVVSRAKRLTDATSSALSG